MAVAYKMRNQANVRKAVDFIMFATLNCFTKPSRPLRSTP